MTTPREEISLKDKWQVETIFPSLEAWEKAYREITEENDRWLQITAFRGKLGEGSTVLREALEAFLSLKRSINTLFCYAHLRYDEDAALGQHKAALDRAIHLRHDFAHKTAWLRPEILALPTDTLQGYLSDPILADYHFYLEKIIRLKPYTLSTDQEALLVQANRALEIPKKVFLAINGADFKFGNVLNSQGEECKLTTATYNFFQRGQDRTLRKNAFLQYHKTYLSFENTLGEVLAGQVQYHLFNARARGYSSCLEADLFPKGIDTSVCYNLIKTIRKNTTALHRYTALRKDMLGVEELHFYDMNAPVIPEYSRTISYKEAEQLIIEAAAALGSNFQDKLRNGLTVERWVDRYENHNKYTGAYSGGCYDSYPFILMNFKGSFRDLFTLAHEVGHSMHSLYTRSHQPFQYSKYLIFTAEVASTFYEEMLHRFLLARTENPEERRYFIAQRLEDIRENLFKRTMFAEFELLIHDLAEKGIPLTPSLMKEEYLKLNRAYFGEDVIIDEEIAIEWAKIPHFYYNFYVYQYATGVSAALALVDKVLGGGDTEREAYLDFLKGGCSANPITLLQRAGVDMSSPQPVQAAIDRFSFLVDQLSVSVEPAGIIS